MQSGCSSGSTPRPSTIASRTGDRVHAGSATIALSPTGWPVAAHVGAGLIASKGIGTSVISTGLMLSASVSAD